MIVASVSKMNVIAPVLALLASFFLLAWSYNSFHTFTFFATLVYALVLGVAGLWKARSQTGWGLLWVFVSIAFIYFQFSSAMFSKREALADIGDDAIFLFKIAQYEKEVEESKGTVEKEWLIGFQGLTEHKIIYDRNGKAVKAAMLMNDGIRCFAKIRSAKTHFFIVKTNCT